MLCGAVPSPDVPCHTLSCYAFRSATKSYITSLCLEKFLDNTSDLVFVEFIANDGSEMDLSYTENQKARFFERFLRKILNKSSAPAVVMMQVRSSSNSRVVGFSTREREWRVLSSLEVLREIGWRGASLGCGGMMPVGGSRVHGAIDEAMKVRVGCGFL